MTPVKWGPYTDPDTGRSGRISSGGLVRYDGGPPAADASPSHKDVIQDELKRNPSVLGKVREVAGRVRESVYGMMVRATPAVMSLLPDVLDTKEDMAKIGFNPSMSGTAGPRVSDPIFEATGIGSHLALSIASRVIAKGIVAAKNHFRGRQQFAEGTPEDAARFLDELYRRVGYSMGVDFGITRESILKALMVHKQFAEPVPVDKPAAREVALAGNDGAALVKLMAKAKADGIATFNNLTRDALKDYTGRGKLFDRSEEKQLAAMLASIRSSSELLGRSRVRERLTRLGTSQFADVSLSTFAAGDVSVLTTPGRALEYFLSLFPTLGIDPQRWEGEQQRRAFTLAASANQALTDRVQQIIAEGMKKNQATADITAYLSRSLDEVGVGRRNPQYAEMVVRTNVNDSFQTGLWEEAQSPEVKDVFPVWEYIGINDHRAGADHRPRFGKYYPRTATFAEVRGDRPYNCRCSLRWVDVYEWADLQKQGKAVESQWNPIAV